jgi:hypothetical protein
LIQSPEAKVCHSARAGDTHGAPSRNRGSPLAPLLTPHFSAGVVRVGCKESGKQGLASAVIGGAITKVRPRKSCLRQGCGDVSVSEVGLTRVSPQADIECTNGLIHVVDAVLIPIPPPPPSVRASLRVSSKAALHAERLSHAMPPRLRPQNGGGYSFEG